MDLELPQRAPVEFAQQAMQMPAQLIIQRGNELCDLLLRDRRGEVNIPGGQAGKGLIIAGEQAMQESGTAAQIADDEERFFDFLCLMPGKQNVIQEEAKPVDELSDRPDRVEHQQKDDSFACQSCRGVLGGEEGAIGCSPKEAEVGIHSVWNPCHTIMEKAREGFLDDEF